MGIVEFFGTVPPISIILFIVGIVLLIIEIFNPGFGFPGGAGILILIIDVIITANTFMQGLIMMAVLVSLIVILLSISIHLASKGYLPKKLVLSDSTSSESGFSATEDMHYLIGKIGTTVTPLRPSGNVDFDGVKLDVVSQGEYISAGVEVEVVEVEGNRIVVRAKTT